MVRIVITGGRGFLGRNLAAHLQERKGYEIKICDKECAAEDLRESLLVSDVVFHLAGVNRPESPMEFETGNFGLTELVCKVLQENRRSPKIVFSSSIQAELDNPYGRSKAKAEATLRQFAAATGACVRIYRLRNVFGKWSRPNYNSVTATFCHNIANELPIVISDPNYELELSYVDDVVAAFLTELDGDEPGCMAGQGIRSYRIQLGELAGRIQAFHEARHTLRLPDFAEWFNRALYATYLSYVPPEALQQNLNAKCDARGGLAEFIKGEHFGQIFLSRTNPGVTRGNHYHHTKAEKFLVVEGEGLIRIRSIEDGPVKEYLVEGSNYQVINIPPGFTHSITNVGKMDMVTLFWASEIFDPNSTDTYYLPVNVESQSGSILLEDA